MHCWVVLCFCYVCMGEELASRFSADSRNTQYLPGTGIFLVIWLKIMKDVYVYIFFSFQQRKIAHFGVQAKEK